MKKRIIEVNSEGITNTFIDGNKAYKEVWVKDENGGYRTVDARITAQLDQYGDFGEQELLELLDKEDSEELREYFEDK